MKTLIIFAVLTIAAPAFSANQYQRALWQFPYDVRVTCEQLNSFTDRKAKYINYKFALECAEQVIADRHAAEEQQAELELMQAKTDWLEANKHSRDFYPWSE